MILYATVKLAAFFKIHPALVFSIRFVWTYLVSLIPLVLCAVIYYVFCPYRVRKAGDLANYVNDNLALVENDRHVRQEFIDLLQNSSHANEPYDIVAASYLTESESFALWRCIFVISAVVFAVQFTYALVVDLFT